jgi:DNA-binding LytR/AlgR family response regulator
MYLANLSIMYHELLAAQISYQFLIKSPDKKLLGETELVINANHLIYFKAAGSYSQVCFESKGNYYEQLLLHPLSHYEERLILLGFFRPNKAALINVLRAEKVSHLQHFIKMQNGFECHISRYYQPLMKCLFPVL